MRPNNCCDFEVSTCLLVTIECESEVLMMCIVYASFLLKHTRLTCVYQKMVLRSPLTLRVYILDMVCKLRVDNIFVEC